VATMAMTMATAARSLDQSALVMQLMRPQTYYVNSTANRQGTSDRGLETTAIGSIP
jgi:hypothetical protein